MAVDMRRLLRLRRERDMDGGVEPQPSAGALLDEPGRVSERRIREMLEADAED